MSKAIEMAGDSGAIFDEEAKLFVFDEEELMAFYHKARAEALREAAEIARDMHGIASWAAQIIETRADREGKE